MNQIDFLIHIDGLAELWGCDRQFLGFISSDSYNYESISNLYGKYGSPYSPTSIFNSMGLYGNQWGIFSAYNPNSTQPPAIVYQSQVVAFVTQNSRFYIDNTFNINPDLLRTTYMGNNARRPPNDLISLYGDIRRRNSAFKYLCKINCIF